MLTVAEIEQNIRVLLNRYHAEYALLFGSYARGEATADSDVDVVVVGGPSFRKMNIFAFAEADGAGRLPRDDEVFPNRVLTPFPCLQSGSFCPLRG